ncbi:MAG: bifunctional [glutamate--ammonia ligase]-adenylyl-L-tyrosine phosphorylase/[glutamate--ammonia-ligase] adenylyltransferase [Nitrospirae bacterium]|nr:bifunctional [glutamate--ammonia ligase]-adenylyl-L-tyrosine phosphorylase/[glutamate--ammonia-ligase] adenylyltransferase [Nitrospirota bacterium]
MTTPYSRHAAASADPCRAESDLGELVAAAPALNRPEILRPAALLFGASRFLAAFALRNPAFLEDAISRIKEPVDSAALAAYLAENPCPPGVEGAMRHLRVMKKRMILRIALRDLTGQADLTEVMLELSWLAEALVETALGAARAQLHERFGAPEDERFAVIGLGKLGGGELNFSSDVDLMYVYDGQPSDETSGVASLSGTRRNRISNHEYYCKLGEIIGKLLSSSTADGFAHRVDLRLRPNGSRGDLAMPLDGYEFYYETHGREWERAALIRSRPVAAGIGAAGDSATGSAFIKMIQPFVFRRSLDHGAIDELKNMKAQIDAGAHSDDIKRGRGGIREIEFFTQSFQLVYGGRDKFLRGTSTLKTLHLLNQRGFVGYDELNTLTQSYIFLRTLEHRIQMRHDLQTHTLPADASEKDIIARSMGIAPEAFDAEIMRHRDAVNSIFRALFGGGETEAKPEVDEITGFIFGEDAEIGIGELAASRGFADTKRAARNLASMRESMALNQTIRTRRMLREILPPLMSRIEASAEPNRALDHLHSFLDSLGPNESALSVLAEATPLAGHLITVFAETEHLSRILIANPHLLDALREQGVYGKRTLSALRRDLALTIENTGDRASAIRRFKLMEDVRLGILFLNGEIGLSGLLRALTKTAEAVLGETFESTKPAEIVNEMAVIGLGKLGGWEITYGSDLDVIFLHAGDGEYTTRHAEAIIKAISSYTREGIAYKLDTRLRPTGSKGPLVQDLAASRRYYMENSELWERQALLRARPVAGSLRLGAEFFHMAREVIAIGAKEKNLAEEIRAMRGRMEAELSQETPRQFDLKFGPGGLNELEFAIQYLQMKHAKSAPVVIVPNTPMAVKRLARNGFLNAADAGAIEEIYFFYRELETMLRLMGAAALPREGELPALVNRHFARRGKGDAMGRLPEARERIREMWVRMVR